MRTLRLRSSLTESRRKLACGCACIIAVLVAATPRVSAYQDRTVAPSQTPTVAPVSPVINFRVRPTYPANVDRLRRTVQVDGVIADGEWDAFYTVTDGPIKGTFYCNWDDNYLYLAAKTDQAATVLFDVDAGGDGWIRSADNLEVVVGPASPNAAPQVVARLLDAANNKDVPAWVDKTADTKSWLVAEKMIGGTQILELGIPKDTASLVLRAGVQMGLRAEFMPPIAPGDYQPTAPFEPHLLVDAVLRDALVSTASGVSPTLTLSDYKCVPGQTLFATLALLNQNDTPLAVRSVTWTGAGTSSNAVNTLRDVNVPPVPGQRTSKVKYRTPIPASLTPGTYTLLVTAELATGKQVQATAAFSVVEPIQVQMSGSPQPLQIVGLTKLSVDVDIYTAVPNGAHGQVEISGLPAGWVLQGNTRRGFSIDREDAHRVTHFEFKVPSTTTAGNYPFDAIVTWHGETWKAHTVIQVVRP